jgi:Leucine-rich repeat (LRR) protein
MILQILENKKPKSENISTLPELTKLDVSFSSKERVTGSYYINGSELKILDAKCY